MVKNPFLRTPVTRIKELIVHFDDKRLTKQAEYARQALVILEKNSQTPLPVRRHGKKKAAIDQADLERVLKTLTNGRNPFYFMKKRVIKQFLTTARDKPDMSNAVEMAKEVLSHRKAWKQRRKRVGKKMLTKEYETYLRSKDWKAKREEAFTVHGKACFV